MSAHTTIVPAHAPEREIKEVEAHLARSGVAPSRPLGTSWRAKAARILVLALVDLAVLAAAGLAAAMLWGVTLRKQPLALYLGLWPLLGLFCLAYLARGLYPGFGLGAIETLRRLSISTSLIFVVLAAGSFVLRTPETRYSRMTFLLAWSFALVLLPTIRYLALAWFKDRRWWHEPAVVIGDGPVAERAIESLKEARTIGYLPRWVLSTRELRPESCSGLPIIGSAKAAPYLAARGVEVALVATEESAHASDWVDKLQRDFRRVIVLRGGRSVPIEGVETRNLGGVLGIEFRNQLLRRRNRVAKRMFDLVVSGLGLVMLTPLLAVLALAVKLASRGPAFYTQRREGLGGRKFTVCKLRTMFTDADERLQELLRSSPAVRQEWEERYKLASDPRVIPFVGRVLRRFSLDELPQLWNVFIGEMSLVGPRPLPDYHLRGFTQEFRDLRRSVRPGITGLWQVMSRHRGGLSEKESYDSYYIRNWSFWMDLYVMARTTFAVLRGQGV